MNPEVLLISRLILHIATIVMLARFYEPDFRFKFRASFCAGLILGSSGALAVQIVSTWDLMVASEPQPQLVLFVFAVFLAIALARGNMATILGWLDVVLRRRWGR